MRRRRFALGLWVAGCSGGSAPVDAPPPSVGPGADTSEPFQPPGVRDVLVVVLDDVGTDAIATYGEHPDAAPTPTLDRLAAEGVLFRDAWAAPTCSPSRAQLLTGRYGRRHGLGRAVNPYVDAWGLADGEWTIPEWLGRDPDGTWSSIAVGKWHLGAVGVQGLDHPRDQGFDHFRGTVGNLSDGHTVADISPGYFRWEQVDDGVRTVRDGYVTDQVVDDALDLLGALPEPWFAYVAFHGAHMPFHAPPGATLDGGGLPARYRAMVTDVDEALGRLLDGLDPEVRSRTWVMVVGDNGTPPEVVLPPRVPDRSKYSLFEGGLGVPLIVQGPDLASPGREVPSPVALVDLLPTILGVVGLEATGPGRPALDGVDLSPLLRDPDAALRREVVYQETFEPNGPDAVWTRSDRAVRDAGFKLVEAGGSRALWDLRETGQEPASPVVVPDEAQARALGRLAAALDGWIERLGP